MQVNTKYNTGDLLFYFNKIGEDIGNIEIAYGIVEYIDISAYREADTQIIYCLKVKNEKIFRIKERYLFKDDSACMKFFKENIKSLLGNKEEFLKELNTSLDDDLPF